MRRCYRAGPWVELAAVTDVGTEREHNEDQCGHVLENEACGLLVVADGVSSAEAGETASQTAVAATLRTFSEQPPGNAHCQAPLPRRPRPLAIPRPPIAPGAIKIWRFGSIRRTSLLAAIGTTTNPYVYGPPGRL
jgi:hypothetical protein